MKNLLNFKRLFMDSHEKQSPQRFGRYAAMLIMLLTLGVGQMWADMGFENSNNGILFSRTPLGGSKADYRVEHGRTNDTQDAGNVSALTMKEWYAKLYQNEDNLWGDGHMYYRIYLKDGSAPGFTTSNKSYYNWNSWNGGWRYPTFGNNSLSVNVLNGLASGIYYFEYYWDATATSTLYCSNNSNNFKIQFTIKPNALTSFSVSRSGYSAGSGTSEDPYIIARGGSLTLTASGSGGTSDANSTIKYKYGSDAWTTSSKTISNITSTTKQSITVKGARRHNSQDLGSDELSVTIYYQAETTYSVSISSGTPSSVYAGANYTTPTITASNVTGYHFDHWSISGSAAVASTTTSPTTVTATSSGATITANYEPNTYNITLNKNGGDNDGSATITYLTTSFASHTAPEKEGYAVEGYYTNDATPVQIADANGNLLANKTGYTNASSQWTKTSDATLYAHWKQTYSVTYYPNFPEGTTTSGAAPTDANEYNSGATVTVLGVNTMSAIGYSFAGWNTNAEGTGTSRAAGSTFSISGNTPLYAQWTENKRTVAISVSPSGAGTLNKTSASVGVATTTTVTATAQPGYRFTGWTATNCSVASTSSASTTLSGNGTAGSGTLVANFVRTYAYLEGRMTVYNAARSTETNIASAKGGWDKSSTRIGMDYDGTNHVFYRHTYKTPAELSAQQNSEYQWFSFKTSTESGTLTSPQAFEPASNQEMSSTGSANKKTVSAASTSKHIRFNSSDASGYALLYFDEAGVWYELEQSLKYDANGGTGSAPATAYYLKGTNATAASNPFTARAYYTFGGWNTAQYITGTNYAAGASVTMNANTTLYAKWTRTVTLNQEDATIPGTTSVTGTYNCATLPSIINPSKTGYTFGGWYTEVAGGGNIIINTSGVLQADKYHWTDASGRFDRTTEKAAADLYAKWTQTVTLDANTANHGSGDNTSATIVYKATANTSITHCTPATGYHLVGYYTAATDGVKVLNADGSFAGSAVTDYITDGKWTKAGATTLYAHYEANTYTIAFDKNDANYVGEATGTTASIAATYDVSYTLTTNGYSREGYTFAGWSQNADGTGEQYTDGQTGVSNLTSTNAGTATLYAKWTPSTYTVSLNDLEGTCATKSMEVTMGSTYGAGTPALPEAAAVTPPAGYIFDGWYTAAGGGTKVTGETQVTTAVDHTLYAHYIQKAQVYFKNTLGWSKVYVTYDAYWDSGHNPSWGSGNSGRIYHEMTQITGTDIYYDDIPDAVLSSWKGNICFNSQQLGSIPTGDYANFDHGQAVFRRDFDSDATMFVPVPNDPNKFKLNDAYDGTWYYSTDMVVDKDDKDKVTNYRYKNGYWVRYNNVEAGYSLKGSWDDWAADHYIAKETASGTTYTYTIRGLSANTTYGFKLFKHCTTSNTYSSQFSNTGTMTSDNCSNWTFNAASTTGNAGIKTTVAGDYTFNFTFGDGEVKLSVDYPFYVGDYKVVYSYTKDGAKTYESEIIKCRANGLDTISVFIHSSSDASDRFLKIAKCTEINASGVPTWNNSYATIDISSVSKSGVYNFIITQDGSAAATGAYWNKYTGNYYIRTAASDGGWDMYKYRPNNIMTLSEYSLTQTLSDPFSHYYCRFIGSTSVDITYAVATDYSPNISGTMTGDATIGVGSTTLPATANVRFSWNEKTNAMRRAYLKNAQGAGNNRYLVLHGADNKIRNNDATGTEITPSGDLVANELLFTDIGNWVYQVELKAIPGAKVSLIANYNSADRYLVGDGDTKWETIIGGSGSSLYSIRAVYDFKTNRLMTAWIPGGEINENISDVDVLLLRYAQDAGTAITFGGEYKVGAKEVIGAIEMRYNALVGHVANWTSSSRPLLKFFVSFPFDVNVSDIFGLNSAYGDAYIVEEYDGAGRAEKGFFGGDGITTFWKELQPGDVMKANVGYCVILDNDYFNGDIGNIWDNKSAGSSVYLYFPSASSVGDIKSSSKTISIPEHLCHHDRTFITGGGSREVNHINTDSHWNMMGVPIFDTHSDSGTSGQPGAVFATSGTDGDGNFKYFYEWSSATNQFSIHTAINYSFKSMHGYMVQYYGDVTFKTAAAPASIAARKAPQKEQYQIELQVLNSNAEPLNSTFVELRENANDAFELNEDVYMSYNNYAVNIYTLTGNYDVAANVLSINDHTIPVGVKVTKAGTYRFSMPGNFSGEVTLLDTFTGESTNLALDDYEVELPKGTTEDRFFLKTNIKKVATAIDGISEDGSLKDGKAHKFLQNGVMYILQNGVLYDAQGKRVQ